VTTAEAARRFRVDESTICGMAAYGDIPHNRITAMLRIPRRLFDA